MAVNEPTMATTTAGSELWSTTAYTVSAVDLESTQTSTVSDLNDWTQYAEYTASVWLWYVYPPVLIFLGTVFNIMSILVWSRKKMGAPSMSRMLTALAISDTIVLYTGVLRFYLLYAWHIDILVLGELSIVCKLVNWFLHPFCLYFSSWLLVAISVERMIAVCWPLKIHRGRCNPIQTSVIVIIGLAVMAILYTGHLPFGFDLVNIGTNGTVVLQCIPTTVQYAYFYEYIWAYMDLVLLCFGPFFILVFANTCIIIKIKYGRKLVSSITIPSNRRLDGLTLKVIALCIAYVSSTTPLNIYFAYGLYISETDVADTGQDRAIRELLWALVSMLYFSNSVINFPLYCLTGRRFVEELKSMLSCCGMRDE
jgi:hypothetical protein